jgi:DNA-binding LytR/AlgR family response regulator
MANQVFFYRKEGQLQRIRPDDIIFLEAAGNYVKLFTQGHSHLIRTTLDIALSQLPGNTFVQIHRSVAIAVDQIDTVGKDFVTLLSFPKKAFPLSKTYYRTLIERINIIESCMVDRLG